MLLPVLLQDQLDIIFVLGPTGPMVHDDLDKPIKYGSPLADLCLLQILRDSGDIFGMTGRQAFSQHALRFAIAKPAL